MLCIRAGIFSDRNGEITISVLCPMLRRALCMCHLTEPPHQPGAGSVSHTVYVTQGNEAQEGVEVCPRSRSCKVGQI